MGCGTGELTFRLQEIVGEEGIVVGVDTSSNMVSGAHVICGSKPTRGAARQS